MFKDFENGTNKPVTPTSNHDDAEHQHGVGLKKLDEFKRRDIAVEADRDEALRYLVDVDQVVSMLGCGV